MFVRTLLATAALFPALAFADTGSTCPSDQHGMYKDNSNLCHYCPPGTYNDQPTAASNCKTAQSGHYACGIQIVDGQMCYGATSQSDCGPGKYQPNEGSSSCNTCPAGSFCPGNNSNNPQKCSPGWYMDVPGWGDNNCKKCQPGTFVNAYGATSCCECCAGTYTDQEAQTHCQDCPNGSIYSYPGAKSTSQCYHDPLVGVTNVPQNCDSTTQADPNTKVSCPATGDGVPPNPSPVNKKRSLHCARGYTSCPVFSGRGGTECIDTRSDTENCGGCAGPDGLSEATGGQDCTAIPNVSVTRCKKSKCVIQSCRKGFMKTSDGKACVRDLLHIQQRSPRGAALHRRAETL